MKQRSKRIKRIFIGLCAAALLTGCGGSTETVVEIPERGVAFKIDQEYLSEGVEVTPYNYNMGNYPIADIYYYFRPVTDPMLEEMLSLAEEDPSLITAEYQETFYETIWEHSRCLMRLTLIPEDEYQGLLDGGKSLDDLAELNNTEEYGKNDGYVYLISIPDYDLSGLSEEEISQYENCKAYMQEVKEHLELVPVEMENNETDLGEQMPEFRTKDLEGNLVTNDIFSEKDLTVVNVWGTFCVPCIEEMPQLAEWEKEMSDQVQLVGLITDIEGEDDQKHLDLAREITDRSGADFTQLIGNEDFAEWLKGIVGVPTTFFVDREGKIVGEPIVGADVEAYRKFVEEYLSE